MNDGETARLVIEEIGKLGKQMAELAKKAKQEYLDTREYILKKPNVENELACLRQKIERSFGKTELALKLLGEKSQSSMPEINQRIDELENAVRGGASSIVGSTIAEERTEEAQAFTPTYDFHDPCEYRHDPLGYLDYYNVEITQGTGGRKWLDNVVAIGENDWQNQ